MQIALKRREAKGKGEKGKYSHLNAEFQKTARREKKAFLSDQCKEIDENNRMERLEISSRKLEILREHFMQRKKVKSLSRVQLFATPWTVTYWLLHPWDSPGNNNGVGCHFLLQGLNPGLPHCRQTLLPSGPPGKMGTIKDRNGMDLTEGEDIKKRWQEYTEELHKKDLHNSDNHNGSLTHLEPDILKREVKWALGSITMNKANGGDTS